MHAQHIDFLDLLDVQVQYVMPRWQRRYRWGQADIERLAEKLFTVEETGRLPFPAYVTKSST